MESTIDDLIAELGIEPRPTATRTRTAPLDVLARLKERRRVRRAAAPAAPAAPATCNGGSQWRSQRGKSRSFRWRKGELLGAGTFGSVYRVLNEDDGSLMAVKELTFSAGSKAQGDEVRQEVELLRNLSHTNIVRYLGTEIQVRGRAWKARRSM